jgi:hypothetical protein
MAHYIPLFRFRLGTGQSIGPTALRRLWSTACGSDDVNVTRETRDAGYGEQSHTYSLCGPSNTANLANIEARLRRLLAATALTATITLTHQV